MKPARPTGSTPALSTVAGDDEPSLPATASSHDVDAFLDTLDAIPAPNGDRGRLIFSLDATASRQPTWDSAMALQGDMFTKTHGLGALDVQLAYYRGYRECRASGWVSQPDRLLALMRKVSCEAGRTQIARLLKHALAETRRESVQALVFIGDAVEEPIDEIGDLAGELGLLQLPIFVFQEGRDVNASRAFASIARLSGGAHCNFDAASADELGRLLAAVAAYATGGRRALERLGTSASGLLLQQLR